MKEFFKKLFSDPRTYSIGALALSLGGAILGTRRDKLEMQNAVQTEVKQAIALEKAKTIAEEINK